MAANKEFMGAIGPEGATGMSDYVQANKYMIKLFDKHAKAVGQTQPSGAAP